MRNKRWIFIGSLLLLGGILGILLQMQLHQTIAGSMISKTQLDHMKKKLTVTENSGFRLFCDGEQIPYDAETNTFYLPQKASRKWLFEMKFSASEENTKIYWCEDSYWRNMKAAIAEGHEFVFAAADREIVQTGKIVFTGLPMLELEMLETLEEDYYYCRVSVFDPFCNDSGLYEFTHCYGYYDLRGKTSRLFPKKGWNLDLVNEDGSQFKMEMMGLREDDDWKLNALYTDATKIKERVCMDLWNELAEMTEAPYDAGTNMEFFELLTDDSYQGIYGMMEQIDYKQLSLDKETDVLYKGYNWPEDDNIYMDDFINRGNYCGQLIKPGDKEIAQEIWQPMIEYIEATNFDYTEESADADTLYQYVQEHMDLENLLNIDLYVQALYASDNLYKNLYMAADRREDDEYTLWKLPWDLNYTFGEYFYLEDDNRSKYDPDLAEAIMGDFMVTEILLQSGNQEFAEILNEKWQQMRNGVLSVEHVEELAVKHLNKLIDSGAYARDEQKWPKSAHNTSLEPMLEFHERRLYFLEGYYASFCE